MCLRRSSNLAEFNLPAEEGMRGGAPSCYTVARSFRFAKLCSALWLKSVWLSTLPPQLWCPIGEIELDVSGYGRTVGEQDMRTGVRPLSAAEIQICAVRHNIKTQFQ
jgi:hypothetical protein